MWLAAVVTTLTALAFGIVPALQFSRPSRDIVRERTSTGTRGFLRRGLVAAEIALALVLLTGAGLLIRSFMRLMSVDPGFSAERVVAVQVFASDRHGKPDRTRSFFTTTLERMRAIPGVEAAGAVSAMPFIIGEHRHQDATHHRRPGNQRGGSQRRLSHHRDGGILRGDVDFPARRALHRGERHRACAHNRSDQRGVAASRVARRESVGPPHPRSMGGEANRARDSRRRESDTTRWPRWPAAARSVRSAAADSLRIDDICAAWEGRSCGLDRGRQEGSVGGRSVADLLRCGNGQGAGRGLGRPPAFQHDAAVRFRGPRAASLRQRSLRFDQLHDAAADARDRRANGAWCRPPARFAAWCSRRVACSSLSVSVWAWQVPSSPRASCRRCSSRYVPRIR